MNFNYHKIIAAIGVVLLTFTSCSTNTSSKKVVYKKVNKTTTTTSTKVVEKAPVVATKKVEETFKVTLPEINRDFRAAWIATVANINWPSKRTLTVDQQKAEAIKLLDLLEEHNFNAVIFQVRPSGDALYKSDLEPWSYFLTGEIGKSPYPFYDPLEFWVEEAHKRGMELHVWLNPYRAHHSSGGAVTSKSMVNQTPDNVVRLKNGMYWFDPADKRTQNHVSNVVKDIVARYDIDGVHFDDYFYPYASYNGGADFPDQKTWNQYKDKGGNLTRADWRRDNVNYIIERVYREIKAEKPHVKFGISPFGIWKPGYPAGITGSSQYDELYADAKLWLNKGWVDYFSPQLYWPINSTGQSFPKLLNWWKSENTHNRHLWPGLNTVEVKAADRTTEIINQVQVSNDILGEDKGVIHWSIAGLTKNPTLLASLKNGAYREKAITPAMKWLKADVLEKPKMSVTNQPNQVVVNWNSTKTKSIAQWVLFAKYNDQWETTLLNSTVNYYNVPKSKNGKTLNAVALKSIDRLGYESDYSAEKIN